MDRVSNYRQIICAFLEDFAQFDSTVQLVFDADRDRYLAIRNQWRGNDRTYGCAMQLDIIENQVWIQQNSTEIYVDRELIKLGVDPKDIVFGFRAPNIRSRLTAALSESYNQPV
ncbi:MAG: XisI protein [Cyanobacteria bacterium J06648_10]